MQEIQVCDPLLDPLETLCGLTQILPTPAGDCCPMVQKNLSDLQQKGIGQAVLQEGFFQGREIPRPVEPA